MGLSVSAYGAQKLFFLSLSLSLSLSLDLFESFQSFSRQRNINPFSGLRTGKGQVVFLLYLKDGVIFKAQKPAELQECDAGFEYVGTDGIRQINQQVGLVLLSTHDVEASSCHLLQRNPNIIFVYNTMRLWREKKIIGQPK